MRIISTLKLDFANVLIKPKRTTIHSRSMVDLNRQFKFPHSKTTWEGVPIIAANMDTTGTFEVARVLTKYNMITALNKFYTVDEYKAAQTTFGDEWNTQNIMVSTGIHEHDFTNLTAIMAEFDIPWICIDVANGYMEKFVEYCRKVRDAFPNKIIIAGNVVSSEMVEELIVNGKVDVVKIGIGPGSACLTRLKTGVGMPQLSAIIECADAAHGVGGYIIGDGGITCPGDMAKAFGGGADFVMCGGVFAGHDENPGELIEENGKKYKLFYGMSSDHAMKKYFGKMAEYRSSEGRVIKVAYRGPIEATIQDYLGGLRSTCAYINARHIKHIPKCTTFVMCSQQLNTSLV